MSEQASRNEAAAAGHDSEAAGLLTRNILIALLLGALTGIALNTVGVESAAADFLVSGLFHVGGQVFLSTLKLLVVPLVLVSLICGTAALDDISKLGRIGGKTMGLYLFTTAVAITLAIAAGVLLKPGAGFDLVAEGAGYSGTDAPPLTQVLIDIFPTNPVQAMSEGNMLQIIVFAVLFGLALSLSGEAGARLRVLFEDLNTVIMRLVMMLMNLAPYGVYCLIATVFARQGPEAFGNLARYFFCVVLVLAVHWGVTYPLLLVLLARLSPRQFVRKMVEPMMVAFSTSSSGATLPVTLRTTERHLGVHNSIASFTVPLGATINMDGTAIMQGVATVFIAQAYGLTLGLGDYVTVILTATLASIGTAGVPGVGLIMLAMVLRQVDLPVEGIGLIIGIDRLLDMTRTAVNITGDAAVTCIVASSEGKLDREIFDAEPTV